MRQSAFLFLQRQIAFTLVLALRYPAGNGPPSCHDRGVRRRGLLAHCLPLPAMSHDQAKADQLVPRISLGLTIAQLSLRLLCAECGGQLHSVKPWRIDNMLGKPLGRRG